MIEFDGYEIKKADGQTGFYGWYLYLYEGKELMEKLAFLVEGDAEEYLTKLLKS